MSKKRPSAASRKKRSAAKTSPLSQRARIDLGAAPARTLGAIGAEIRKVLAKRGVTNVLSSLHFEPVARPRRTAARRAHPVLPVGAAAAPLTSAPCPEGQVRRVVCFFRRGTFVCQERCVPA
jgi:hypothetical protein